MDMRETKELAQFRAEVRGWVKANYPKAKADPFTYVGLGDRPGQDDWFKLLAQKGWLAYRWPKEFGGPASASPSRSCSWTRCWRAGPRCPPASG